MNKRNYNVLGVMSGTSLDGVDLARVSLTFNNAGWNYKVHECATIPYSNEWADRLKHAIDFNAKELDALNTDYTLLLGQIIKNFTDDNHLSEIDAVCSHGHTVLHQPDKKLTLQIGNKPEIAQIVNQFVVCDFRVQDVAMGGQGAPLVPIGDRLLFSDYSLCLNLGGFSNISFETPAGRKAYDVCPVNTVLNYYSNKLGLEYDNGGAIAAKGAIDALLLSELNELRFYKTQFPKSLGFEFVKGEVIPLIEKHNLTAQDVLATYSEHIAVQIAAVVNEQPHKKSLLVTGGGAYNKHLVERLQAMVPNVHVVVPDDKTIQYKEALIFALLGVLRLEGQVNVLSSVTGAPKDHCAGIVFKP